MRPSIMLWVNMGVMTYILSALAGQQAADGGWPINWETVSPMCELEWRGWKTLEALVTLRAYGRI